VQTELLSPNQTTVNLRIRCTTPASANFLLRDRIRIEGQLVTARKDLKIPLRCNKRQGYGHLWGTYAKTAPTSRNVVLAPANPTPQPTATTTPPPVVFLVERLTSSFFLPYLPRASQTLRSPRPTLPREQHAIFSHGRTLDMGAHLT
jgi:hypothetical protein